MPWYRVRNPVREQDLALCDAKQALEVSGNADLQLEALEALLQCASTDCPYDVSEIFQAMDSASYNSRAIRLCAATLRAIRQQAMLSDRRQVAIDAALRITDLATQFARRPGAFLIRFPEK